MFINTAFFNKAMFGVSLLFAASFTTMSASASIIINTDQSASGSLGPVNVTEGSGMVVFGETNGTTVRFEGTESLLANGGQARISSQNDSTFTDLLITVPGFRFDRLVFRLFNPAANGTVTIKATDNLGVEFTQMLNLNGNGEFFNVESDALQQIASVSFTSSAGVQDIRQVRVGGFTPASTAPPVPEPGTYALLASGLAACAFFKRRQKNTTARQ